jgi:hypothetical protein
VSLAPFHRAGFTWIDPHHKSIFLSPVASP